MEAESTLPQVWGDLLAQLEQMLLPRNGKADELEARYQIPQRGRNFHLVAAFPGCRLEQIAARCGATGSGGMDFC